MPGTSHMGPGKTMAERSTLEVVGMFILLPIPAGIAFLVFIADHISKHSHEFTLSDWFWQVGFSGVLAIGLLIALPLVGF